jgi:hypothetical protein
MNLALLSVIVVISYLIPLEKLVESQMTWYSIDPSRSSIQDMTSASRGFVWTGWFYQFAINFTLIPASICWIPGAVVLAGVITRRRSLGEDTDSDQNG